MANLGLYHPTHNPFGCKLASDSKPWYETAVAFNSTKDCFTPSKLLENSGTIASGNSGQPTNSPYLYADAIYSGQIKDLRLSAHKQDVNKLRVDTMRKAVAGEMRGWGKVPFTKALVNVPLANNSIISGVRVLRFEGNILNLPVADILYATCGFVVDDTGTPHEIWQSSVASSNGQTYMHTNILGSETMPSLLASDIMVGTYLTPQNDTLAWTDILGSPSAISATFPNGVQGMWIPQIPDGTGQAWEGGRKIASSPTIQVKTVNNGVTWETNPAINVDVVLNGRNDTLPPDSVILWQYQTLANFTQPADNSVAVGDMGDVAVTTRHEVNQGNRLHESLLGNIGKDITDPLTMVSKTKQTATSMSHQPHDLTIPANNATGCKVATSIIEKGGLLYSQYQSQEIQYSKAARDWGDNLAIPVVNGDNVVTDDNGITVKVVNHISTMPLGIASHSDSSQSKD